MKKFLLAVLSVVFISSISFAVDGGFSVKGGIGENHPEEMLNVNKNSGIFGVDFFLEENLPPYETLWDVNKFGIKFGGEIYGHNKVNVLSAKEKTFALPLTLYFKLDQGIKALSTYFGPGITYIRTNVKILGESYKKGKIFPHLSCGFEYRFTENFAFGIDLKYNISAKIKKEGFIMSDRSGFQGAGVVRFYF